MEDIKEKLNGLNYKLILTNIELLSIFYVLKRDESKIKLSFKLHEALKHKYIKSANITPQLISEFSSIDYSIFDEEKLKDSIMDFSYFVEKTFPSYNLVNFYNNINNLIITNEELEGKGGRYNSRTNILEYDSESSIYHELFHMASSIYKDNISYCGFHQASKKYNINIGKGINEGYTEILTHRFFEKNIYKKYKAYENEQDIVSKLEKIVDQERMELLYLNANFYGLISELKKYVSEEEAMSFITMVDFYSTYINSKEQLPFKVNMIKFYYKSISEFLIKAYINKLKKLLNDGLIDIIYFKNELSSFISSIKGEITIDNKKYEAISKQDIDKMINDLLITNNNGKKR